MKTTMDKLRKEVRAYGKRLSDEGVNRAAVDLSTRAENAVKRDFLNYFYQTPTHGAAGKTVRTGRLRSSVKAVVRDKFSFGVSSNVIYARIHEIGGRTRPYVIRPKRAKALRFTIGGKTIFAKSVKHPGSAMKARYWMSKPMAEALTNYLEDLKRKMEAP